MESHYGYLSFDIRIFAYTPTKTKVLDKFS